MRKVLQSLVASGNTLLHGSPKQFDEAFPNLTDMIKACGPGRAGYSAHLSKTKCTLEIRVCEKMLSALLHKNVVGYVHVVDSAHFSKKGNFEYRAYDSLYVQKSLKVTTADLPFMPVDGQFVYKIPVDRKLVTMVN